MAELKEEAVDGGVELLLLLRERRRGHVSRRLSLEVGGFVFLFSCFLDSFLSFSCLFLVFVGNCVRGMQDYGDEHA